MTDTWFGVWTIVFISYRNRLIFAYRITFCGVRLVWIQCIIWSVFEKLVSVVNGNDHTAVYKDKVIVNYERIHYRTTDCCEWYDLMHWWCAHCAPSLSLYLSRLATKKSPINRISEMRNLLIDIIFLQFLFTRNALMQRLQPFWETEYWT